jgi:LysM repeat protein
MICDVIEETPTPLEGGPSACPFVAFEEDRDHRSSVPDYRHRCFAAAEPEPRAFPHQERYCLAAAFPQCPIFLDWARQEAAGVTQPSAASATGTTVGAEAGGVAAGAALGAEEAAPPFLAGRSRPAAAAASAATSVPRSSEASASLWNYEDERKRTSPPAPAAPSSLGAPAVAMARRGPSHPGWENPPRLENFPRLRSRDSRRANQPLLLAAIGVSILMVALIMIPILTSQKGIAGGASQSPTAGASQNASGQGASGSLPNGASPTPLPSGACPGQIHSVKPGDSLALIAQNNALQLWEIIAANPSVAPRPDHLEIGWKICIPPAGFEPTPAPSST